MSLHECRIYDGKGKLKQTVGFKQVTTQYWQQFTLETADYVQMPGELTKGKKRAYTIECKFCEKKAKVIRRHSKYCSQECKGKAAYKKKQARLEASAKKRYTVKCKICKKDWQAIKPNMKYCGKDCKQMANILKNRRASERAKINLARRKSEIAEREEKIFQRKLSTAPEGSQDGQAHPVQTD